MPQKPLPVVLAVVVVGLVALGIGVLVGQNRQPAREPAGPPAVTPALETPEPSPSPEGPPRPTVETHRVIQEAINAGDVNTLKTHMADTVTYGIASTECCGDIPRGRALSQLRGSLGSGPFDFSPTNSDVLRVREFATRLTDYLIGVGGMNVLGYRLNAGLKIDAIYEADLGLFATPAP